MIPYNEKLKCLDTTFSFLGNIFPTNCWHVVELAEDWEMTGLHLYRNLKR